MTQKQMNQKIKINSLGKTHCAYDWHWDTLNSNCRDFDLWTVIRGEGRLKTPNKIFELVSGDCFILRSEERYIGTHNQNNPLVIINVHFDFLDLKNNVITPARLLPLYRRIQDLSFFEGLLDRVLGLYYDNPVVANKWMQMVLWEIFQQDKQINYSGLKLKQHIIIEEICNKIKKKPNKYHSVEEINRELSYSKDHFLRIFKKIKGITPYEYVLNCRIEDAKNLLLSSSYSISRIGQIVGYKDICHFSRQFKERIGVSPSDYRKGNKS